VGRPPFVSAPPVQSEWTMVAPQPAVRLESPRSLFGRSKGTPNYVA
jgi:hypothetical protein